MTKVTIDRELLERVAQYTPSIDRQEDRARAISELRSVLESAPRQPEGEGLEVVAWAWECLGDHVTADKVQAAVLQGDGVPLEPLCRLSDAQRAIAELRAERDTLRQQLAERDAQLLAIASAEPSRHNIEWAKAMAATGNNEAYAKWRAALDQRDKLAGLLRMVRQDGWYHPQEEHEIAQIDAALAEVNK